MSKLMMAMAVSSSILHMPDAAEGGTVVAEKELGPDVMEQADGELNPAWQYANAIKVEKNGVAIEFYPDYMRKDVETGKKSLVLVPSDRNKVEDVITYLGDVITGTILFGRLRQYAILWSKKATDIATEIIDETEFSKYAFELKAIPTNIAELRTKLKKAIDELGTVTRQANQETFEFPTPELKARFHELVKEVPMLQNQIKERSRKKEDEAGE